MRLWSVVLISLFLSACATTSKHDDLPVSDLNELRSNAWDHLKPRVLQNGKTYCAELATTEREQDTCMGMLEDAFNASELDKAAAWLIISRGLRRMELQRNPCSWWERFRKAERCQIP